jgi:aminopeptidase N
MIHQLNRAQILDDSFQLARANQLSCQTFLEVSRYLIDEEDLIPWQAALKSFVHFELMIAEDGHDNFRKYLLKLLTPLYNKLGFKGGVKDTHVTVVLRRLESSITWVN